MGSKKKEKEKRHGKSLLFSNYAIFFQSQVPDDLLEEAKTAAKAALEEMDAD